MLFISFHGVAALRRLSKNVSLIRAGRYTVAPARPYLLTRIDALIFFATAGPVRLVVRRDLKKLDKGILLGACLFGQFVVVELRLGSAIGFVLVLKLLLHILKALLYLATDLLVRGVLQVDLVEECAMLVAYEFQDFTLRKG